MMPSSETRQLLMNRRGYRRFHLEMNMEVWPESSMPIPECTDQSIPRRAVMDNVSLSGLLFYAARPYPVGTVLWMRMRLRRQTHFIKGIVRRAEPCRLGAQQIYGTGIQFVRCPQTLRFVAEVAGVLDQAAASLDSSSPTEVA
jgi:hypothetical protein